MSGAPFDHTVVMQLMRIAEALERVSPPPVLTVEWDAAHAFIWSGEKKSLEPVPVVHAAPLALILGVDQARDALLLNTMQFAAGYSANNALLWGARGMGKSSLVKAIHRYVNETAGKALKLIEIHREDIQDLPQLMEVLRGSGRRHIVFCDDLTFDGQDASYKSLKTALEGGIAGRPENTLFYATSNRRHMMPREMIENERATAIHAAEVTEEKVSLSDRFGLWLGFHACTLEVYLGIAERYAWHFGIAIPRDDLRQQALLWANARGARSGRVAWQFIQDLAGKMRVPISNL